MADELPDVPALRTLDPPPGGLTRLRARLDEEARRPRWLAAIPLAALAVIALVLVLRRGAVHDAAIPQAAPTMLPDAEVSRDGVAFYWVASSTRSRAPRAELTTISSDQLPPVEVRPVP